MERIIAGSRAPSTLSRRIDVAFDAPVCPSLYTNKIKQADKTRVFASDHHDMTEDRRWQMFIYEIWKWSLIFDSCYESYRNEACAAQPLGMIPYHHSNTSKRFYEWRGLSWTRDFRDSLYSSHVHYFQKHVLFILHLRNFHKSQLLVGKLFICYYTNCVLCLYKL